MAVSDCEDCGTELVALTQTGSQARHPSTRRRVAFPSVLLRCPRCGTVWERDLAGVTTRRAPGLANRDWSEPA